MSPVINVTLFFLDVLNVFYGNDSNMERFFLAVIML